MFVAVNVEYIGILTIFLAILCNRVSSENGCALLKNEYIIDVALSEAPTENGNNYDRRFLGFRGAAGSIKLDIEQDDSTVDFHSNFKIYLGIADFNYGFCIKRTGNIDRDGKTSKYSDDNSILEYTVVCTDLSSSVKFYYPLIIRITDLNDNPPVFKNEPFEISVSQSTANGSTLIRVVATDKDIDKNRHIVYGIESGSGTLNDASQYFHFPVISSGALSLKKPIDTDAFKSEGISSMTLNIFAMDMGRKSLRTDSSIKVNIDFDGKGIVKEISKPVKAEKPDSDRGRGHCVLVDRPEFANESIKVKLPEVVSASDLSAHPYKYRTFIGIKDTVTNINIVPDSEEVGVEYVIPQSGQRGYYIRIKQVIDRDGDTSARNDDTNNLKFDLECESNDIVTVFPLTIHITDINDNAPEFENDGPIEFTIAAGDDEDLPREVFNISEFSSVSDRDAGPNRRISYSIGPVSDEKGSDYFIIDKYGAIHQVKHIGDDEEIEYLYFNITITDNARNVKKRKSSSRTAKVKVIYKTTTTTSTTPKPVVCNIDTAEFTSHKHGIYHLELNEVKSEQHLKEHTDAYTRYIGFNAEAQISLVQHGDNDINPEEYFELIVEGNKQYIRLIKPIDRDGETDSKSDDTSQVEFTVECKQNGPIKYYPIVIHIDDVNDNAPVFQNTPYLLNINEATRPGEIVYGSISATDKDLGTNREITYGIVPNLKPDYSSYFSISPMEGEILLTAALDFEKLQTKEFQLNISATNGAPTVERLSSYTTLTVTVVDSDDLPPVFHFSSCNKRNDACFNPVYKTNVKSGIVSGRLSDIYPVPENELKETVSIQAKDQDSLNNAIVFTIDESIPDGYKDYFTVETTGPNNDGYYSALVNQVKIIQRSSVQKLKLVLKATEDSSEDKMARAELDIEVVPSNLNPPRLVSSSGQFNGFIEENSKTGSFVLSSSSTDSDRLQITVEDDDVLPSDPKRAYDYSISPETSFAIDDEGFITNIAAVDREQMSQYSLTLTVTETDTVEKHKVSTSLVVYVLDVNDNAPMFTRKSIKVNITEGDYSFSPKKLALVSALDDDTEESGKLSYSILDVRPEGEDSFKINSETGELTAKGELNADIVYSIRVQATDNGVPPRSSMSVIEINTVPKPNSAPYFSKDAYKFIIPEDFETGNHVFQFEAFDPDNDELNYAITSGNIGQTFSIDSSSENSGELIVSSEVDFESIQSYDLIITATDKRGLTGETTVHINITDVNDNDPIFSSDVYEGSLIEGDYSISPKQVLIVKAEDKDSTYNGQVEYAITKSSPPEPAISINAESGAIEVNGIVKGGTVYTMTVQATDKASIPKTSTARVKLTVIPKTVVNNAPVIPQSDYTVSVSEGTALSSEIVQISASDPDSDVLSYKIVNQIPDSSAFQIDESGIISNTELLDREDVDEYTLQVEVTDSQGLTSDTKVVIKVTDMNDNTPKFTHKNYVFTLVEGQMGQFVVAAFDKDEVETGNSLVTYSFSEPNDKFDISSDGKITTKAPLDREENENYEMVVVASDNGLPVMTSTANVRVQVTDTSDSVPMFNPSIYEVQVPEGKRDYSVVTVKAVDADVVKNVIYIFEDGDTADFIIDSITGEIKTRKALNKANKSFYSFTVTTTDGQDVSSALVSVTVVGEDVEIVKPTIIVSEPIIPDRQKPTESEKPVDVGDDKPPVFSYPTCVGNCRRPEYAASVQSAASLFELSIFPMPSDNPTLTVPLKARDPNTPQSPLNFTISRTVPSGLESNFVVKTSGPDNEGFYSATVKQVEPLYVDKTPHVEVIVRATEDSNNKLYSEGAVYIDVKRYYVIEGQLTAESTANTLSQMNILTFLSILTIFYLL